MSQLLTLTEKTSKLVNVGFDIDDAGAGTILGATGGDFEVTQNCRLIGISWGRNLGAGNYPLKLWDDQGAELLSVSTVVGAAFSIPLQVGRKYTIAISGVYGSDFRRPTFNIAEVLSNQTRLESSYLAQPPAPLKVLRGARAGDDLTVLPHYVTSDGTWLGDWIFKFELPFAREQTFTIPDSPLVVPAITQFNVQLPSRWQLPSVTEWDLQYATSVDDASWGEWIDLRTLPGAQKNYQHTSVQITSPTTYYKYRYRLRTRILQSNWSAETIAGQPRINTNIQNESGQVNTEDITPGAVGSAELAPHGVKPIHISADIADIFLFPTQIAAAGVIKSTQGGFVFPDNTTQATAYNPSLVPKKYALTMGAITAGSAYQITHGFGTRDVDVTVYSNGNLYDDVIPDVLRPTVDKVELIFAADYPANTFRVVIMG